MNREILFRGKRVDNGEWIYGNLLTYPSGNARISVTVRGKIPELYGLLEFVIPETVGQYIGLKDKNGKRIFEGDIAATNKFGALDIKYIIEYDVDIATYIGVCRQGCIENFTTFSGDADVFEIIGNIHDNPELMKGAGG